MIKINIGPKQRFISVYRKFQRLFHRNKILNQFRAKAYYEKPTTIRRQRKLSALRRNYAIYKLPYLTKRLG